MTSQTPEQWNKEVTDKVKSLASLKRWLGELIDDPDTDWESQKSAHQALKYLELSEYEMWNMQYWENRKQRDFYKQGEDTVIG